MRNGISTIIPSVLVSSGANLGQVYNVSVGATGSLFGLENLVLFGQKKIDLVFVEYGINDLPIFSNDKTLWEEGYRSLFTEIIKKYPEAHIVNILLGRQAEKFWGRQEIMHQKMSAIAAQAGALVVDINDDLKKIGTHYGSVDLFYRDSSHYVSPVVTRYISELIVSRYFLNKSFGYFDKFKNDKPLTKNFLKAYRVPGAVGLYENSLFRRETSVLDVDASISIEVQGTPVAISFISEKKSCSLLIEFDGFKKIINTRRREADEEKFDFLLKQIPLYKAFDPKNHNSQKKIIKITAVDSESECWNDKFVQNTFGMVPAVRNSGNKVFIGNISTLSF